MAKLIRSTKVSSKEELVPVDVTSREALASLDFQMVRAIKGIKFPIGSDYPCYRAGINKWNRAYIIVLVDDEKVFGDPKNFAPLGPIQDQSLLSAIKADREESSSATLLVAGKVLEETAPHDGKGGSIKFKHSAWAKAAYFPLVYCQRICDLPDGEEGEEIWAITEWKLREKRGPEAVEALKKLQANYQKVVDADTAKLEAKKASPVSAKVAAVQRKLKR